MLFYARNDKLGLVIPYEYQGINHSYEPDFLVRLVDGRTALLEMKGYEDDMTQAKHQAAQRWVTAVNNWGKLGQWVFPRPCHNPNLLALQLADLVRKGAGNETDTTVIQDEIPAAVIPEPSALRLTCELVPSSSWGNNIRKRLPKMVWDQLREECYRTAKHRCEICGSFGTMEAHEVWAYDDSAYTQTLVRLISLCSDCHQIKHFGRSVKVCSERELDALMIHFIQVNSCDEDDFDQHLEQVQAIWAERSRHEWQLVLPPEIERFIK